MTEELARAVADALLAAAMLAEKAGNALAAADLDRISALADSGAPIVAQFTWTPGVGARVRVLVGDGQVPQATVLDLDVASPAGAPARLQH